MSDLLDGRYVVQGELVERCVVPAHDTLLDQPVDIVLLPPVPEPIERSAALRRFRRELRNGHDALAAVDDTGVWADHPFLVLPAGSRAGELDGSLPASRIAPTVLEALDGVQTVRDVGLGLLSLEAERLRKGARSQAQVIAVPLPVMPTDGSSTVPAAQRLLRELLDRNGCSDEALRRLTREPAGTSAGAEAAFVASLRSGRAVDPEPDAGMPARRHELAEQPATAAPAEKAVRSEDVVDDTAPAPAHKPAQSPAQAEVPQAEAQVIELRRVKRPTAEPAAREAPAVAATATKPAAAERHTPSAEVGAPAQPKYVSLTDLAAEEAEYVSFDALLSDGADEDEEAALASRQAPVAESRRGLFGRRGGD